MELSSSIGEQEIFLFIGFLDEESHLYVGGVNTKEYYDSRLDKVRGQPIQVKEGTVVEVSFSPLFLFTGRYLLWIEIADRYRHIFSDYKGICPFFVSEKGATTTHEAYLNHPITVNVIDRKEEKDLEG